MGLRKKVARTVRNVVAESTSLSHCFDSIRRAAAVAALAALATVASTGFEQAQARSTPSAQSDYAAADIGRVATAQLPPEAVNTLGLIAADGPYPYEKDGVVFGNYERMLPSHRRGYYHEYTVPTPHARNRGARRIVCGGPLRRTDNCYYSDDHYASFKRIVE
ncbi:ribonuclease [Paraburkholderia sp. B3]